MQQISTKTTSFSTARRTIWQSSAIAFSKIPHCWLEHIITAQHIDIAAKPLLLLIHVLSLNNRSQQLRIDAQSLATMLHSSKPQVLRLQQHLAKLGYLEIQRPHYGRQCHNLRLMLPKAVIAKLRRTPDRYDSEEPKGSDSMSYLLASKLFIPLPQQVLKLLLCQAMSATAKMLFIDCWSQSHQQQLRQQTSYFSAEAKTLIQRHHCCRRSLFTHLNNLTTDGWLHKTPTLKQTWSISVHPSLFARGAICHSSHNSPGLGITQPPVQNFYRSSAKFLPHNKKEEKNISYSGQKLRKSPNPTKVKAQNVPIKALQLFPAKKIDIPDALVRKIIRSLPPDKVDKARRFAYSLYSKKLVQDKHELAKQLICHIDSWHPSRLGKLSREQQIDVALATAWKQIVAGRWHTPRNYATAKILQAEFEAELLKHQASQTVSVALRQLVTEVDILLGTKSNLLKLLAKPSQPQNSDSSQIPATSNFKPAVVVEERPATAIGMNIDKWLLTAKSLQ